MAGSSFRNRLWICGAVTVMGAIAAFAPPTLAQLVEDTAPGRNLGTTIQRNFVPGIDLISDGTQRGQNLFHSFREFNIGVNRGAYFFIPNDIVRSVLTRVTGGSRSEILGTLGTVNNQTVAVPGVNLFLINPNGIVFSSNASLDVGGSFFATTANAVRLGNAGLFGVSQPESSNLLTVDPSAFLFNAIATQAGIEVRSRATRTVLGDQTLGLRVPIRQNLLLLGGSVNVDGGLLNAYGGRVEIGAVAGLGAVELNADGSLQVPDGVLRADVSFTNSARVDVSLDKGGDIGIMARNIAVSDGSLLKAGIDSGFGAVGNQAGDVTINATGAISFDDGTAFNNVSRTGVGQGGDIRIATNSLELLNGSLLNVVTLGQGNTGSIFIQARNSIVVEQGSSLGSLVVDTGTGKGGDVTIEALNLTVRDRGSIGAETVGNGSAGNLIIRATDSVNIDKNGRLSASTISSGSGGGISLQTGHLTVKDNGRIVSFSDSSGSSGSIEIQAKNSVEIDNGAIQTGVTKTGTGNAGNIVVASKQVLLSQGGRVATNTDGKGNAGSVLIQARDFVDIRGTDDSGIPGGVFADVNPNAQGNAGDITVATRQLNIRDGAQISTKTTGFGNVGKILIHATDSVNLSGENAFAPSGLFAQVNREPIAGLTGTGNSGDLTVDTQYLTVSDGAQISVSTFGAGNAGNLIVHASEVNLEGKGEKFPSGLFADVNSSATGNGGNLTVEAGRLNVENGATISASTEGLGRAGDLFIHASDFVMLNNGALISAQVGKGGRGRGGNLTLRTGHLVVSGGSQVATSIDGIGAAGDLFVDASIIQLTGRTIKDVPSGLFSQANRGSIGNGGNLTIETERLLVQDGAVVSVSTGSAGQGGVLVVNASESIELDGKGLVGSATPSTLAAISVGSGSAGDVRVKTDQLIIRNGAEINASTFEGGNGGDIQVEANSLSLNNGGAIASLSERTGSAGSIFLSIRDLLQATDGSISTTSTQSSGGGISIIARDIRLRANSDIKTNIFSGSGNGGNITLTANSIIALNDSDILAFARDGRGGNITLNTRAFFGQNYRPAPPGTDPLTLNGNERVDVNASGTVSGIITIPDTTFVQNSLTQLAQNLIDPNTLLANSCIVRNREQNGSFFVTGSGGLPVRPGDAPPAAFPTGEVRSLPNAQSQSAHLWQPGDPIVEPQGIYRLSNGKLVMSRECQTQ